MKFCRLTITDYIDVIVVVAVVDAPAWEAALSYVGLVALALDLREPHHPTAIAIRGAIASPDSTSEVQHPVHVYACKCSNGR